MDATQLNGSTFDPGKQRNSGGEFKYDEPSSRLSTLRFSLAMSDDDGNMGIGLSLLAGLVGGGSESEDDDDDSDLDIEAEKESKVDEKVDRERGMAGGRGAFLLLLRLKLAWVPGRRRISERGKSRHHADANMNPFVRGIVLCTTQEILFIVRFDNIFEIPPTTYASSNAFTGFDSFP
ncbi:hypothetical protein ONZ45_g18389 [Pleurotus djamor]|nr:hypothetical protein ONZ45_g18389 [Pleurotus djamor]